ncbi:MAG: GntR family transcriptional regulator [Gemmatimonadales bacterium]|nr:GntR family transcriptional regulator [Gemmatimonadales bacterium]
MGRRADIADLIRQRVFSGLHVGSLAAGQRLPSVRELAQELGADPRVVMAAYRELEREGLVEVRARSGIFVPPEGIHRQLRRRTADWMVNVLIDGLQRGVSARDFPGRVREVLETVRLRAACIECNHDQINSLCGELHDDYGFDATGIDTFELQAHGTPPGDVQQADLLVSTPFHVIEVRPVAAQLGKPFIIANLQVDYFADAAQRLQEGPVYFVVTDPRFEHKLRSIYSPTSGAEGLHVLIVGRDDIDRIPEDAPTYVTRLARDRLSGRRLPGRLIPEVRAFSPETSRQLFSFVVQANLAARFEA